ncbi:MAG: carboxypeptidase regulatory-like domain-containing protein [Fibrobacter sp.]|uniref:carboxypeptidase regulatory-like domain-containing protein n=1 Tax=Fibrobacter sp. TaxID=35828 RepID=UPI0025BD27DF|nr:carboxypeptidase regulatory-like domain-containing protein [Fibrobacter sp.]MBR4783949.1 carboxypeptidase regulatory-like domain-containing protein [Fibrobacter sp.]
MKYSLTMVMACGALLLACTGGKDVGGTATDTENMMTASVTGLVKRSDGTRADSVVVRMSRVYSKDETNGVPEFVEVKTDTAGVFAFDSAIADTFQLAVIDESAEEISYLPRVVAAESLEDIKLEKAAHFESVLYYDRESEPAVEVGSHFLVYMPGMPFVQNVFAKDSFSMLIPAGSWWFGFCPGDPQMVAKLQDSGVADSLIYRVWSMDSIEVDAGGTLDVGPFFWSTEFDVDTLIKEKNGDGKSRARISGQVNCDSGRVCSGIEVMAITDIYGFDFVGDSSVFRAQTVTDSDGRWWLPVPAEVPYDSFRVEFRAEAGDSVMMGLSRYVMASEVAGLEDTLDVGTVDLTPSSGLVSTIALVIGPNDSTQSLMVNSVVVGAKGTAHFVRGVTYNSLKINEMPSGEQELLLYSGDTKVISTLQAADTPVDEYVVVTFVNLPKGDDLEWQGMTYTPPALPKSAK